MTKKTWLAFFALFIMTTTVASAEDIITTVFNVFESKKTERILVLSGVDGRIYKSIGSESNLKLFKSLIGEVVKISYRQNGKEALITNIKKVDPRRVDPKVMNLNHFQYNELRRFAPTDLQSVEAATEVFKGMLNDGDRRRSQCFKRAHMWAYDMWSKLGISSQKIFIFYTKRFSILEDFDWWFHVAPMVIANGKEYVLDGTFMEGPITVNEWKNNFIHSKNITCPVIDNYLKFDNDEHEEYQWNRLCYLMKVPMYYFRPLDIEDRDARGIPRNHWELEELQDARRAFKNFDESYEGLDTGKRTITH